VRFRQLPPIPPLRSIVECLWTLEADGATAGDVEPVLPDGCPELVIQFGDRFDRLYADGTVQRQSDLLFGGQLTGQIALRPTGAVATLGIRFRPGSAAAILHMPQLALVGTTLGVDVLDQNLYRWLSEIRDTAASLDEAVVSVQRYLCGRLDGDWVDRRVLEAVGIVQRCGGQIAIDVLARHVATTRRHLERRFDSLVGISPKRLARIVRFQRALRMLHARPENPGRHAAAVNGAATALECGYADQPHFIREFTELAGCPPGAHLLRHAQLSGFFTRPPLSQA
jgi:AraC-like DNA-binding protein